jgi:hypothetical protein
VMHGNSNIKCVLNYIDSRMCVHWEQTDGYTVTYWAYCEIRLKRNKNTTFLTLEMCTYRGAGKSLARPTSRCILFDGANISFDDLQQINDQGIAVKKYNSICMHNDVPTTCFGRFLIGHHQVGIQCQRNYIPTISTDISISVSTEKRGGRNM